MIGRKGMDIVIEQISPLIKELAAKEMNVHIAEINRKSRETLIKSLEGWEEQAKKTIDSIIEDRLAAQIEVIVKRVVGIE